MTMQDWIAAGALAVLVLVPAVVCWLLHRTGGP